ncbi:MAG TPA: carbon monoxide dehydrogenase subunit G [Ktedonobacteraceae bacterium]|nr:carbon monoxide dehydrogenase subunit G [Ktedonobacteraceae bacterium]
MRQRIAHLQHEIEYVTGEGKKIGMDITGSQKIKAPRAQVFSALLNPDVLKASIPGCESAQLVEIGGSQQLKLQISPNIPGLKGPYDVFLQTGEVVPPSRVVLIAEPTSSLGSVKATCTVDLADEVNATNLSYNAHAAMEGKIAATPEIILKGAVKVALDQFFKNFEKQVSTVNA